MITGELRSFLIGGVAIRFWRLPPLPATASRSAERKAESMGLRGTQKMGFGGQGRAGCLRLERPEAKEIEETEEGRTP